MIVASYLRPVIDPKEFPLTIKNAKKALRYKKFDAIAVRGNSGTLFGGALALAMKKSLFLIRKRSDNAHAFLAVEGDKAAKRYIFVDDLIDSGCTRSEVKRQMTAFFPDCQYVGDYLYGSGYGSGYFEGGKR